MRHKLLVGSLVLAALSGFPSSALARGRGAVPVDCTASSFPATAVASPDAQMAQAGITLGPDVRVVRAVTLPAHCAAEVRAVFSGGVILASGESYELRDNMFIATGPARRDGGAPCRTAGKYIKCLNMVTPDHAQIVLATDPSGGYVDAVSADKAERLLQTRGSAAPIDLSFLPAPDAPGGNFAVFVRTSTASVFLVLFEPR